MDDDEFYDPICFLVPEICQISTFDRHYWPRVYLRSNMALLGFPQWRKHWQGIKVKIWSSLNIPVVSVRSQNLRVVPPPPSRSGNDSIGLFDFTSERREKNNKIKMFTWFSKTIFWKRNDQSSKGSEEMKKTKNSLKWIRMEGTPWLCDKIRKPLLSHMSGILFINKLSS